MPSENMKDISLFTLVIFLKRVAGTVIALRLEISCFFQAGLARPVSTRSKLFV